MARLEEYRRREIGADAVVHAIAIAAAALGSAGLMYWSVAHLSAVPLAVSAVYCAGLNGMLIVSAAYNFAESGSFKAAMRRADHAVIYFKIGSAYAPVALALDSLTGLRLLIFVWLVGIAGATIRLASPIFLMKTSHVLYLVQGWAGLLALGSITRELPGPVIELLLSGGVLYSVGFIFYLWRSLLFQRALWHAFVAAGATCHFFAVFRILELLR